MFMAAEKCCGVSEIDYFCSHNFNIDKTMSEATLTGLLEYLYNTLSPSNMRWMGEHLIEYANAEESAKPYTVEELLERAEKGRREIAEGHYTDIDQVLRELDMDFVEDEMKNHSVIAAEELQYEAAV